MTRKVSSVVIVGRDAAAWLTALGLQRSLGRTGLRVEVVELPSHIRDTDVYSSVPSIGGLFPLLGLSEADVLRNCAGVPVLGQRFVNWSGAGSAFIHGYDTQRPAIGDVDFLQYWVSARRQGLKVPYEDFSLAAVAAKQGRVAPPQRDPTELASVYPGYHLDAQRFVGMLRQLATRLGVQHRRGVLASVEREGKRIRSVALTDGSSISGDMFVDATGVEGLLIADQPGAQFESWRRWLPTDRLLAASAPKLPQLPSYSQIVAFDLGWLGLFPLQDRTAVVASFASSGVSDDRMLHAASVLSAMPLGNGVTAPFEAGMQARPWIGNCIAMGEAAISLDPLDGVQLLLSHTCLSHLIALFPVDADDLVEAESYNHAIGQHARNVRDFQIAHYRLNGRTGEPFWDQARVTEPPPVLASKLDLFGARGQVPLFDDESFEAQNWTSIFIGHGLMPRDYAPAVDAVPEAEQMEKFQRFLHYVAAQVRDMPTVADYLAGSAPPPPPPQPTGLF